MSQQQSRRGVADAESWFEMAQAAHAAIDGTRIGEREQTYRKLARQWGTRMQVPQRLVRCARFIAELGEREPALAESLQVQPVAAIDFLNSWWRHDAEGALSAAHRLKNGEVNLTGLKALEDRRPTKTGNLTPGQRRWQALVSGVVVKQIEAEFEGAELVWNARGWGIPGPRINLKVPGVLGQIDRTPGIHFAFNSTSSAEALLAAVNANPKEEERRPTVTTQAVFHLLGLRRLGYDVVWLTNVEAELDAFRETLSRLNRVEDISTRLLDM